MEYLTPACAARFTTTSGLNFRKFQKFFLYLLNRIFQKSNYLYFWILKDLCFLIYPLLISHYNNQSSYLNQEYLNFLIITS